MTFKNGYIGLIVICKFTISAITYPVSFADIPDKMLVIGNFTGAFRIVCSAPVAVIGRPVFFKVIGSISTKAPVMPVGTYFTIRIKIVEQHKFTCNGVLV